MALAASISAPAPGGVPRPGACPVCGERQRSLFVRQDPHELFRCAGCDLVYLDPPPDAATLARLYADPYDGATTGYFQKAAKKLRRARQRVRRLVRYLDRPPAGARFLDVGCNGGFMAEAAREAGFEAWGVDPDGAAVAYARRRYPGSVFIHARLEDAGLGDRSFDVVSCAEVIEHVPDCQGFMALLARLTRPGGLLFLTTPDIGHWRRPRDVTRWDAFCPPSHCLYFNPRNLARLLAQHGFSVVHRRLALKPGIKLIARRTS